MVCVPIFKQAGNIMQVRTKTKGKLIKEVEELQGRLKEEQEKLITCQKNETVPLPAQKLARSILEQSTDAIIICDENGKIIQASQIAHRFFPNKLLGRPFDSVCRLAFTSALPFQLKEFSISSVVAGKIFRSQEVTHKHDGQVSYFLLSARPLLDGKNILGCVVTLIDLTEHKQMEEELRRSRDESDIRVQERTAELTDVVEALQDEMSERKRAEEALRESENRLRSLSSQLLTVQESERRRIARELHDGVGQMLTAVKFKVESVLQEKGEGKARARVKSLEPVIPMIRESMEEVRRIQTDLRPSVLDDLGVLAALSWLCRNFEATYSHIHIERQTEIREEEVSTLLKTVIYRVSQEALNNIAKHSKADLARLSLKKIGDKIELKIEDNGMGFDLEQTLSPERARRGMGLDSMRERAELSGGAFAVESTLGAGTTIKAEWQL